MLAALQRFYEEDNANVHRGAHKLAVRSTEKYEGARESVAKLIGASTSREVIHLWT